MRFVCVVRATVNKPSHARARLRDASCWTAAAATGDDDDDAALRTRCQRKGPHLDARSAPCISLSTRAARCSDEVCTQRAHVQTPRALAHTCFAVLPPSRTAPQFLPSNTLCRRLSAQCAGPKAPAAQRSAPLRFAQRYGIALAAWQCVAPGGAAFLWDSVRHSPLRRGGRV